MALVEDSIIDRLVSAHDPKSCIHVADEWKLKKRSLSWKTEFFHQDSLCTVTKGGDNLM
jgi:hypothetical protein